MRKTIKGFVLGVIITTMLMSTVFGAQVKKTIDVIYNSINITLNDEKSDIDNFLYEGTTYVPLRAISEMFDKEVGWDGDTNTASIYDKETDDKKLVKEIAKIDSVVLFANRKIDGMYEKITVQTKDISKTFPWTSVTNPTYAPTLNMIDVDGDFKDEVIILLTTDYGTGVLHQEIHILNFEDLTEIDVENPVEAINKKVTSTITNNDGKVNVVIKWDENILKKDYDELDAGIWFDELIFGAQVYYEIVDSKINAMVSGAVSPSIFPVTTIVEYDSDLKIESIVIKDGLIKETEKDEEVFYDEPKKILWDDNNMHFDRISFGDNLEKILYRMGEDPDEIIKNDDGSIIYKCIIEPVKEYSTDENGSRIFIRDVTPEETVYFYTNGSEQIKRENLKGVYKIVTDSNWSAMMGTSNDANGTYEGLLKTYGIPDSREFIDSNGTEKIWYQLQSNKTRFLFFDIKDGKIINHGMEIKY